MNIDCVLALPLLIVIDDKEDPRARYLCTITYELKLPFVPTPGHAFLIQEGTTKDSFDLLVSPVEMTWLSAERYFEVTCAEMGFASEKEASKFIKKAVAHNWEMQDEEEDEDGED